MPPDPPQPVATPHVANGLTSPVADNPQYDLDGQQTYSVTVTSSNHACWITGVANLQLTGVSWRLWIDVYGSDLIASDNADNQTVTLTSAGRWDHPAGGTGILTGARGFPQGAYTARAYSSLCFTGSNLVDCTTYADFSVVP